MTIITPLALYFLILMSFLLLALPRKYALVPFFLSALYMTLGQRIVLLGFNFTLFRVLIVIGFMRIIIRKDVRPLQLNNLDKAIILWAIIAIITAFLLDINTNKFDNLQHRSGQALNALGSYFIFRFYITSLDDIKRIIKILSIIITPLAVTFLIEKTTGRNIFFIFGGVPEFTNVRYGRLRCQGPFAHPILAGTLGATLMPLFVSFWFETGRKKLIALMGIISSMFIMIASASSGPLLAWLAAIIALIMWPLRNSMKVIRWLILTSLIILQMIMTAPVWFLIGKIADITGGTGWHRSELIDTAIKHFNEWWMIGTTYTAHWLDFGPLPNPEMIDITNQYILEGVYGGLPRMIVFISIIIIAFRGIGHTIKEFKDDNFATKYLPWTLGAALFAHAVGYISVAYFDQLVVMWYLLLAMISTISQASRNVPAKAAQA